MLAKDPNARIRQSVAEASPHLPEAAFQEILPPLTEDRSPFVRDAAERSERKRSALRRTAAQEEEHDGRVVDWYREMGETSAWIVSELVRARKAVRADAMKRLRGGGNESAVRLVQKARQAVDVHLLVRGKPSRTEWRAIHTVGEKGATGFEFRPPEGMTWAVMVKERA